VVGDIHGCWNQLRQLLSAVKFCRRDRLVAVGDLIDRGPHSLRCLLLLNKPWFWSVRGNHEDMLLATIANRRDQGFWLSNGGEWAADLPEKQLESCGQLITQHMPLAIVVGSGKDRWQVVHAEIFDRARSVAVTSNTLLSTLATTNPESLMWGRSLQQRRNVSSHALSTTWCGHTTVAVVKKRHNHVWIDTGAVWGGALSLAQPTTGKIWSVDTAGTVTSYKLE